MFQVPVIRVFPSNPISTVQCSRLLVLKHVIYTCRMSQVPEIKKFPLIRSEQCSRLFLLKHVVYRTFQVPEIRGFPSNSISSGGMGGGWGLWPIILCNLKTKHWRCIKLYIFGILMTRQTIWYYFQRNLSMFQFLTHVEPSRSMAAIFEMPQYVAYQKNVVYAFIKLSAKSHSFNILCTMDGLSCPTNFQNPLFDINIILNNNIILLNPQKPLFSKFTKCSDIVAS